MRSCDRVVFVARELGSADDMAPHGANCVSSLHVDDGRGNGRVEAAVAGKVAVVDVQDGVVGVRRADANKGTLVL